MRSRHLSAGLVLGTLLGTVALTACQTSTTGRATPVSADQRPASDPATSRAGGPTPVTNLRVVVVENHSLREMRGQMPATFALAREYGFATRYRALTHPSLPNYLVLAGGSTFGVTETAPGQPPGARRLGLRPGPRGRKDRAGLRRGHAGSLRPRARG